MIALHRLIDSDPECGPLTCGRPTTPGHACRALAKAKEEMSEAKRDRS
jgi:hypothetical protein